MNLRFAAYATAAVLIGFAVMMLPLALETTPTGQLSPNGYNIYPDGKNTSEQRDLEETYGLASQPQITTTTIILTIGLIIALTVYILVKKQINPPPPYQKPYKPF